MVLNLDHIVINAKYELDKYRDFLGELGFTLTPRGYHSLGSANHLIVFEGHYLELAGLLTTGAVRKELEESAGGIDGLVFSMENSENITAHLLEQGLRYQAPQVFTRPIIVEEKEENVAFKTVRLEKGQFEEGRIYFCKHLTPQYVWRKEWMSHENSVTGICALAVVLEDTATGLRRYASLGEGGSFKPDIFSPKSWADAFGFEPPRKNMFTMISFKCTNVNYVQEAADKNNLQYIKRSSSVYIFLPDGYSILEFK